MFMTALHSDIGDIQGGTTKEGIHLGVMAGTLNLIQRGYLGMELQDSMLYVRPKAVDQLNGLSFTMQLWGTPLTIELATGKLGVSVAASGATRPITITVNDMTQQLRSGEHYSFDL
jgi:trehalose/maltose hydrolase-like predicted phosphorylase